MNQFIQTDVCIVGGGPAGAMLGLLLARNSDLNVLVLEQRQAFQREFRGESISQGSVVILDALGILDHLRNRGYLEVEGLAMYDQGEKLFSVDFHQFQYKHKFIIDLPQPVLIDAILDKAKEYPNFRLEMGAPCVDVIRSNEQVKGVVFRGQSKDLVSVECSVVVDASGRYTRLRELAGIIANIETFKRDAVWFRLPRPEGWENVTRIKVNGSQHLIILPTYPNMLRVGVNIAKGTYQKVKTQEIGAFHEAICQLEPELDGLVQEYMSSWKDTVLLDIFTADVPQWSRDGFVLVGDSAHTVSPILGQGVNLAIQDTYVLAPVIQEYLEAHPKSIVPKEVFQSYEQSRREHVNFVQGFQADQEKDLMAETDEEIMKRRMKMKMLDQSPMKMELATGMAYGIFKENLANAL